jgi:hypothetical protein
MILLKMLAFGMAFTTFFQQDYDKLCLEPCNECSWSYCKKYNTTLLHIKGKAIAHKPISPMIDEVYGYYNEWVEGNPPPIAFICETTLQAIMIFVLSVLIYGTYKLPQYIYESLYGKKE